MLKVEEKIIKDLIEARLKNQADLASFKREVAKKYKTPCQTNVNLLKTYHEMVKNKRIRKTEQIENLLKTRPIRSLSGIVNVSVLTKPYPCPGRCLYCPIEKGIPKSYVSGEPAVERAKKLNYDPYLQVKKRIEMLESQGHPTDKIELRIVGGTWSYYPKQYQNWFVKKCVQACNEFDKQKKSKIKNRAPHQVLVGDEGGKENEVLFAQQKSKLQFKIRNLKNIQKINEKAKHRVVGLSIETRPDFISIEEIKWLRKLGVTMVELGVQSIYDDVLKLNLRGHGIKETILATKLLKDAGFKVLYQMMPNLPGSNLKQDEKMFEELFKNPNFQPDLLKIYPTALLKEAPLYRWWRAGKYKPYSEKSLINLIKKIKKKIPYYVRIQRISRDIPSQRIVAGPAKISNLRQVIAQIMKKESWQCHCIRCREVREKYNPKEKLYLFRQDYDASDGKEIFLSFENKNHQKLYSSLRLRIPSPYYESGSRDTLLVLKKAAIVREIHTYGQLYPLDGRGRTSIVSPQHRGLGKQLIKEAEKIVCTEFKGKARKDYNPPTTLPFAKGERAPFGLKKMVVISGVGTRGYFRKLGYKLKDTYMVKRLYG